jgi:hypothetical protein
LPRSRTTSEARRFLDNHFDLDLDKKLSYSVDCLGRNFIFSVNREFTNGVLWHNVLSRKGILGPILAYHRHLSGYTTDRVMVSHPISKKKVVIEMLNLRGETLYSGIGNVRGSGIDFVVENTPAEGGTARSAVSGRIGRSVFVFKKATTAKMVNKKRPKPAPSPPQALR